MAKSKGKSATARTLEKLREQGALAGVVERFNSFAKVRQDLFGFIDIIALRGGKIVAIQATSASNHAAHIEKVLAASALMPWLGSGGLVEVWSWKPQKVGKRQKWYHRIDAIEAPVATIPSAMRLVTRDPIQGFTPEV